MAFDLDFSHIPSVPGLPSLPTTTSGFSDTSKTLLDKITSNPGSLFSNPMIGSANFFGDSVTRLESQVKLISTGQPNDSITANQASAFLAADGFQDVRTSMGNFMMHVGRLSGLLQSQGIAAPGLQQILSIGLQMQSMLTLLQAGSGCLAVIGGATGLFSGGTIDQQTSNINKVLSAVEQGTATIADITDTLSVASNLIRGIASKDSQFLQNCVNQLQAASVGLVLETLNTNPCAKFVFEQVANRNPGGLLDILSKPIIKQ